VTPTAASQSPAPSPTPSVSASPHPTPIVTATPENSRHEKKRSSRGKKGEAPDMSPEPGTQAEFSATQS
jgi:hypothetical protein